MAAQYKDQDPLALAHQAERDLNTRAAKTGSSTTSDTAAESGVDPSVTAKFPDSTVQIGSAASGAGDNREIPVEEGGDLISKPGEKGGSGHPTKARDFEGEGGPETKQALYEEENPGSNDVGANVKQKKAPGGEVPPTDFGGQLEELRERRSGI